MRRRDLWWRVVCPGTVTIPNPAARARAAVSTTQEVSSPNQPINGKRHGRTRRAWKQGRANWRNPRPLVREMCWRKEEPHLWESPPPSHTPLRAGWKSQVSGETQVQCSIIYITKPWNGYIISAGRHIRCLSLNIPFFLAVSHTHRHTLSLSHTFIHSCSPPFGLLESGAMYQTPINTHSLPASQPHTHTHWPVFFFPLFLLVQPFLCFIFVLSGNNL